MQRTSLVAVALISLACGAPAAAPPAHAESATETEAAVEAPRATSSAIDGDWAGGSNGGPIQSSLTWRFHGGAYSMDGYPAIGETGRFVITSDTIQADGSHALVVRFTSSRACDGPCGDGEGTPRDDREISMSLSSTTSTLTFGTIAYARVPPADS
jgi:hypothetical protein